MSHTLVLTIFFTVVFLLLAIKIIVAVRNNEKNKKTSGEIDVDSLNISNLDTKLKEVIKHKGRLHAIKLYREFTGANLEKSKTYINDLDKSM